MKTNSSRLNRTRCRSRQNPADFISGSAALIVTYPGTNNYSSFTYDGMGRNVKIVETVAGTTASTKQFVWCFGNTACEARDGSSAITAQYFPRGQTIGGKTDKYCYTLDHLGSVRELTDSSGSIQAQYSYDPYGQATKLQGSLASDFQYAGYYVHATSGLNLTRTRAYSTNLGRWINRDPIEERGGNNLYAYVRNNAISRTDPMGLSDCANAPPMRSDDPAGQSYGTATYLNASEMCYFKCAGDSPWAQQVRGCLMCEQQKNPNPTPKDLCDRHKKCYDAAGWGKAPYPVLIYCEIHCSPGRLAY